MADDPASTRNDADIVEVLETPRATELPPALEPPINAPILPMTSTAPVAQGISKPRVHASRLGREVLDRPRERKSRVIRYPSRSDRNSRRYADDSENDSENSERFYRR